MTSTPVPSHLALKPPKPSLRYAGAPFRATAAFALSFAALSLALASLRIHKLQRFDARWPADLHWALELITWPFIALAAAVLFAVAATLRRTRVDPWPRALSYGVALAALIAAPSLLGAQSNPPLASWLTWLLALVGPLLAGAHLQGPALTRPSRTTRKRRQSAQ